MTTCSGGANPGGLGAAFCWVMLSALEPQSAPPTRTSATKSRRFIFSSSNKLRRTPPLRRRQPHTDCVNNRTSEVRWKMKTHNRLSEKFFRRPSSVQSHTGPLQGNHKSNLERVATVHSSATNVTQAGEGTMASLPVAIRRPVWGSIRKTTRLSESWFATTKYEPVGSIAKLRGV